MKKHIFALMFVFIAVIIFYFWPTEYDKQLSFALEKKEKNPNITVFDGEVEPPLPNSWENNKTLLGVDANKNGIRDDLDIIINRNFEDYNERMAIRQYVRTLPKWYEACESDVRDSAILNPLHTEVWKAAKCLVYIGQPKRGSSLTYISDVFKIVLNNHTRKKCSEHYDRFFTGFGDTCMQTDKCCEFKIKDPDRVREKYEEFLNLKYGDNKK